MTATIKDIILYFGSNADTMVAGKALRDAGITAKMRPTPASLPSDLNLCLSIAAPAQSQAKAALLGAGIALAGII
jgi:hypothetical protein